MVHAVCAVNGCFSSSRLECCQDLSWHRIPGDKRKDAWLRAIGRPDLAGKTKLQLINSYVCSLHFEPWLYKEGQKKKKLPFAALPTLNPVPTLTFDKGFKEHDVASVDERMPTKRTRKTTRGTTDMEVYQKAAGEHFKDGAKIRALAKKYNVCHVTLSRYIKKLKAGNAEASVGYRCVNRVFTVDEENKLQDFLIECSGIYFGLCPSEVRKLAYELAVKHGKTFPVKWHDTQKAGREWLVGFLRRHPTVSTSSPQARSLSLATSFNENNVDKFFDHLATVMDRYKFEPKDIWNMDEMEVTTVQKPSTIVAQKEIKQVDAVPSAEPGRLVTVAVAINAQGGHIPPFFVFPLKRYQDNLVGEGPVGSAGAGNASGWMQEAEFLMFLEHFKKQVRPTVEQKCLLLLDNHASHKSIQALEFCKTSGIILVSYPPDYTHTLQPLGRRVFGPFKRMINTARDNWMRSHPGCAMNIHYIPAIVKDAFPLAVTDKNAIAGFTCTGISPFNRNIFTAVDYAPSSDTECPLQVDSETPLTVLVNSRDATFSLPEEHNLPIDDPVSSKDHRAESNDLSPTAHPIPVTLDDAPQNSSTNESSADANQCKEEIEESDEVLSPEELEIKQEIEDSISEHEEDIIEKLNRKRQLETDPLETAPVDSDPLTELNKKVKKRTKTSKSLLKMPEQSTSTMIRPIEENGSLSVDFMKLIINSQNEILSVLKSQVLLQNPDPDLLPFLRFVGAKLSYLDESKRKEIQNAIIDFLNNS